VRGPWREPTLGDSAVRLLIVTEDMGTYLLVRDLLRDAGAGDFVLEWTPLADSALESMMRGQYAAYLVGCRSGDASGPDFVLGARRASCCSPIILLVDRDDRAASMAAIKAGADDCLEREWMDADLLERSIQRAIGRRRALDASASRPLPAQDIA